MMKLQTPVIFPPSRVCVSFSDGVALLGSCFADSIGSRLVAAGFDACVNPFGTLYNPRSIAAAVARLDSGAPFTAAECVEMGAGAGLVCSFSHHTSFARPSAEEFLSVANASLEQACAKWRAASKVLITLGTAFRYERVEDGTTVANCLKRPACEFKRVLMPLAETEAVLADLVRSHPDKQFIFTVSPVRHLSDGAHANQISKSILLMAIDSLLHLDRVEYFPAYEIFMDELRDYRFYAEDMAHPSQQAADYIWERFCDFAVPVREHERLKQNEKAWRQSQHRPLH